MNQVVAHLHSLAPAPTEFELTYTEVDKEKVRQVYAWLNAGATHERGFEHQRTQAKLGRAAHIAISTLHSVLSGNYKASPTKFLDRALAAIASHDERAGERSATPFVRTSLAKIIFTVCRRARLGRDIGVIAAAPGLGKTFALKEYAAQNPMTLLIEATEHMSRSVLLRKLVALCNAQVITKGASGGTQDQQFDAIVETLKGSEYLLLVDEADTMAPAALNTLRRISDLAGIGVVLTGEPRLHRLIYDPAGRFSRIGSRFCMRLAPVMTLSQEDSDVIVEAAHEFDGIEPAPEVLDAYWQVCGGSARVLNKLIVNVREFVLAKGYKLTAANVFKAGQELMGITVTPHAATRPAARTGAAAKAEAHIAPELRS